MSDSQFRSRLIRLASTMPTGSPERRTLLAALLKVSMVYLTPQLEKEITGNHDFFHDIIDLFRDYVWEQVLKANRPKKDFYWDPDDYVTEEGEFYWENGQMGAVELKYPSMMIAENKVKINMDPIVDKALALAERYKAKTAMVQFGDEDVLIDVFVKLIFPEQSPWSDYEKVKAVDLDDHADAYYYGGAGPDDWSLRAADEGDIAITDAHGSGGLLVVDVFRRVQVIGRIRVD